MISKAFAQARR
jgi:aminomethyltransferase